MRECKKMVESFDIQTDEQKQCKHCWHHEDFTHAVYVKSGIHLDEYCCLCNQKHCENRVYIEVKKEHGKYFKKPFELISHDTILE